MGWQESVSSLAGKSMKMCPLWNPRIFPNESGIKWRNHQGLTWTEYSASLRASENIHYINEWQLVKEQNYSSILWIPNWKSVPTFGTGTKNDAIIELRRQVMSGREREGKGQVKGSKVKILETLKNAIRVRGWRNGKRVEKDSARECKWFRVLNDLRHERHRKLSSIATIHSSIHSYESLANCRQSGNSLIWHLQSFAPN